MPIVVPAVSALYAALLGLLAVVLTVRVILNRVKFKVNTGDGGHPPLAQAIRAHCNFAEQAPLALLLIIVAEASGTPAGLIHGLGGALVLARIASAWGLSQSLGLSTGRQAGAGLNMLVIVVTCLLILYRVFAGR
jgi:uncharacterized membrane protein YecN with MAPEG domain